MALGGVTPGLDPLGFYNVYDPVLADMDPTPDTAREKMAVMARQAVLKGLNDGGGVGQIKLTTDQSGATGQNDYFSALGYNA
ncbi:MAG: hypothetical protein K0Q50_2228 [Vampirovibrio sp.]|jgi:hypothetical protein|nr:hypothetical protein [Vampirovibrio sp.]